ncbi:hypothetical protein AYL99_02830 [Fonsecaea erecta]|uniref:Uncharacterized protein n=1 Tax=Fonsecaea erecta TaxID=1367422 RepID=A0A178ZWG0_9EURO|nr:hypothetical protein AYL99_02830 [Fonsecaea erecta]OAP63603.1 hypothetical protein AYL99_02830 [Fonsecaea erecta]
MRLLFDLFREDYRGPLTNAVEAHDFDQVELLLKSDTGNDKQSDDDRTLAMRTAVENDDIKMVDLLMGNGVKANVDDFITAVQQNNTSILELMLLDGYDINDLGGDDLPPPLTFAVDNLELVTWLLNHGADPNRESIYGWTPFSFAVANASREVIELMLERGASVKIVQLLLKDGAPVNTIQHIAHPFALCVFELTGNGTPLHLATSDRLIKLLLEHGADPQIKNTLGELPRLKLRPLKASL